MTMPVVLAVTIASATLAGCIAVDKSKDGEATSVDISTPVGALAVQTGGKAGDTGLPVYPGAVETRERGDGNSNRATVNVSTPWAGIHVVAGEYQTNDTPAQVASFYRARMGSLGLVTECAGSANFEDGRPVCSSDGKRDRIELLEGTEARHRIVSITPRNGGTRFALVSIQTGEAKE